MSELNNDVTPLIFGRPKPEAAAPPESTAETDLAGEATGEFGASGEAAEQPAGEAVDEDLESVAEADEPVAEQPAWLWPGTAGSSTELDGIDGDGEPSAAAAESEAAAAVGGEFDAAAAAAESEDTADVAGEFDVAAVAAAESEAAADVTAEYPAYADAATEAAGEAAEPAELDELTEDVELWSEADFAGEPAGPVDAGELAAGVGDLRAVPGAATESGEAAELTEDVEPGAELWSDTDLAEESGELASDTGDLRAVPAAEAEPATEPEASEGAAPERERAAYTSELKLTFDLNSAADAEPSTYGHPEVDAAVERLAELDQLETADHVEVYEDAHHRLHAALLAAGKDEGAAADSPSDYA